MKYEITNLGVEEHKLRKNLVTWYKFTFAIYRKHDSKSLYCYLRLRE